MTSSKNEQFKALKQQALQEKPIVTNQSEEPHIDMLDKSNMEEQINRIAHPISLEELKHLYKMLSQLIN